MSAKIHKLAVHRKVSGSDDEQPAQAVRNVPRLALSVSEFAESVGVHPMSVYRWIKLGLPTVRVLSVTRIEPEAGLAWMRAQDGKGCGHE